MDIRKLKPGPKTNLPSPSKANVKARIEEGVVAIYRESGQKVSLLAMIFGWSAKPKRKVILKKIRSTNLLRNAAGAALIMAVCFMSHARAGGAQFTAKRAASTYLKQATYGIRALQRWYVPKSGLYQKPTDWWNAANAITVLVDYSRATHSSRYLKATEHTFQTANAAYGTKDFINDSNDDAAWWALAWIDAYDLTKQPQYLAAAEVIFADMTTQWDTTTCGGGVWWSKDLKNSVYKNAVTNELFLALAASLANRVTDSVQKGGYLSWAQKEWVWFSASGMINSEAMINDGLNISNPASCTNNKQTTWTYNQGVILGGLVELYKANHDPTLLPRAKMIATATITHLVTPAGVLEEPLGEGPDRPQFKGVFMRNLVRLNRIAPSPEYRRFAMANADSIWSNDRTAKYQFGSNWQGPFDTSDGTRQTAALDGLIAAAEMQ